MEEFNTIDKCLNLFKSVNCIGNDNKCFIAYKDLSGAGTGLVGGMTNGMEYPYDAVLVNKTENGIGMIFLVSDGIVFNFPKLEKLHLKNNEYVFINNENISEIIIKKYALLNSSKKKISIKTNDGKTYKLFANVNETLLPYHNEGFNSFVNQYNK